MPVDLFSLWKARAKIFSAKTEARGDESPCAKTFTSVKEWMTLPVILLIR